MRAVFVYALVCPVSHLVRYVGRTFDVQERYRAHCRGYKHTSEWVRSLPSPPVLVVLQAISLPGNDIEREANALETKWIKRFRRTVINKRQRENCPTAWDALSNR